jgi:hypothetical protein
MDWGTLMSEPVDRGSSDEQTEILIYRREVIGEAVTRFAKYTAPAMLAVLISTTKKTVATPVS